MRCTSCKRLVASGAEATKMICEYEQPDGTTRFFGFGMADGVLTAATGRLKRAWHHKCYHVDRKREARGDILTGRVLPGGPTAYEMSALGDDPADGAFVDTRAYTERLNVLRSLAARLGKAVGDPTVVEAFWAHENGTPYTHDHQFRLETYQLMAHLHYAHGHHSQPGESLARVHDLLHVQARQQVIDRIRNGEKDRAPHDWREQHTAELAGKDCHE